MKYASHPYFIRNDSVIAAGNSSTYAAKKPLFATLRKNIIFPLDTISIISSLALSLKITHNIQVMCL